MRDIISNIKYWFFIHFHKVYEVRYRTHGKIVQYRYVALGMFEPYNYDMIVETLAMELRIKRSDITIVGIARAKL